MARIKNSIVPNLFGGGQEQIISMDDGSEYRIKNSIVPNVWGTGNEQIIEQTQSPYINNYSSSNRYAGKPEPEHFGLKVLLALIGLAAIGGLGTLLAYILENFVF